MDEEFKPGDLVYLKSGSPRMVISAVAELHCHVFWCRYGSDEVQERTIPKIVLRKHQ